MRSAVPRPLKSVATLTAVVWFPVVASARMDPEPVGDPPYGEIAQRILGQQYGLSDADVRKVARGKVITDLLETENDYEVSIISIAKVSASREHLVGYARELRRFANTGFVTAFGRLTPSELGDGVTALEIRNEDLKAVRSCKPGDCDMKLPEPAIHSIAALASDTDEFASNASGIVLGWLRDYLESYRSGGNESLVVFADRPETQPLGAALQGLLTSSAVLRDAAPELYRFLATGRSDGVVPLEECYYWSVEEFGMRPLTTITQQVVYRPDTSLTGEAWVAQKMLYASHYLQASLRLARLVEGVTQEGEPVAYLIYLQHLMFDGRVGGLKRAFLTSSLQRNVQGRMEAMRRDLEGPGTTLLASDGKSGT